MVDRADRVADTLAGLGVTLSVRPQDVAGELRGLSAAVGQAISSFAGLHVQTVIGGCPVTYVLFATVSGPDAIGTSVRIPLPAARSSASAVSVRFFARAPGAFVDLATDLTLALGLAPSITAPPPGVAGASTVTGGSTTDDGACIHLDADLPPFSTVTAVIGLAAFDTVNQAIGALIEEGHPAEGADEELDRRAGAAGVDLATMAGRIVAALGAL